MFKRKKKYSYNERWSNPSYINTIHDIRALEKQELGEIFTECLCEPCNPQAKPVPPKGVGAGSHEPKTVKTDADYRYRLEKGWLFPNKMPIHSVCIDVEVSIPSNYATGYFKHLDEQGRTNITKVISTINEEMASSYSIGMFDYKESLESRKKFLAKQNVSRLREKARQDSLKGLSSSQQAEILNERIATIKEKYEENIAYHDKQMLMIGKSYK